MIEKIDTALNFVIQEEKTHTNKKIINENRGVIIQSIKEILKMKNHEQDATTIINLARWKAIDLINSI